jgi:hypothetical protein
MEVVRLIIACLMLFAPVNSITVETRTAPLVPTVAEAKAYARERLGATQYECFHALMQRESRWRVNATNRNSGAYGIPQALPGSKMRSAGADWRTNPITQVKWAIRYVNARYGSSCRAYQHALEIGWY